MPVNLPLSTLTFDEALHQVREWSLEESPARQIAFCNVHVLATSIWNPELRNSLSESDLILPDGAPIAWLMRRMGHKDQKRIAGPDFMLKFMEQAATSGESIFLLGSSDSNLEKLKNRLTSSFPSLTIAGCYAPPFRPLTAADNRHIASLIKTSGAKTVWVGLGCPKQEVWIHQNQHAAPAIFLGVGAAFDFLSDSKPRAPRWMQDWGLEWLFRLRSDPRRLFARYLLTNTVFLWIVFDELIRRRLIGNMK